MKKFVVMINYGVDGYRIHAETDSFEEAVAKREEGLSISENTAIFKPVELVITEKDTENKSVSLDKAKKIAELHRYIKENDLYNLM
jgi:hypothetical protein